jgi:hypothetical protein
VVEGFVGEDGEGQGFFGVCGDVEDGGGKDFNWRRVASGEWPFVPQSERVARRKKGIELSEQERVLCAAAGDDELGDFVFGEDEAVESFGD